MMKIFYVAFLMNPFLLNYSIAFPVVVVVVVVVVVAVVVASLDRDGLVGHCQPGERLSDLGVT